jgi:thymidylate kinase
VPVTERRHEGQLFSIDAADSRNLLPAARKFLKTRTDRESGFSTWDASSIFYELHKLEQGSLPSARTLLLLYAADLRFRLRWEILPALEEGQLVVAIPYVETGIAFGLANGISHKWLNEVFRFAPAPVESFWLGGSPALAPANEGFLEFCSEMLPKDFFQRFTAHFVELQTCGKCKLLQL